MVRLLITLQFGLLYGLDNYQEYVTNIYQKIPWRFSDQNFLKNVALLYLTTDVDVTDGGFWRVLKTQFIETQDIEKFENYYNTIR